MARALRIPSAGGHHHVTARGDERREIFWADTDRVHFLELLSALGRRAGRMGLAGVVRRVGTVDYAVVSKAIARFEQRMRTDPHLREELATAHLQLSK